MTSTTGAPTLPADLAAPRTSWQQQNHAFVELQLRRVRILLGRRSLWLRHLWSGHLTGDDASHGVVTDAEADLLLHHDRGDADRFLAGDPAARALSDRLARAEEAIAATVASMRARPPALEVLVQRFGLTSFERDVILLCLAPELDPAFARLFAYVQDAPHLPHATAALAEDLFGPSGDAWVPTSPLLEYRIVGRETPSNAHAPRALHPLRLDQRIEDYLRGTNRLDQRVRQQLRPLTAVPLPDRLRDLVAVALAGLEQQTTGSVVVDLVGPPDVGRVVAAELLRALGLQPHEWQVAAQGADPLEVEAMLRLVEREAVLLGLGLFVDATSGSPAVGQVVERSRVLVVAASRYGTSADRVTCDVSVPDLTPADRAWFWGAALGPATGLDPVDVAALAHQFELSPQAIAAVVSRTRRAKPSAGYDDLWQACRARDGRSLRGLATRIRAERGWNELVLPDHLELQLHEIVGQVSHRARVYDEWGMGDRLPRGRGITALFAGPSGTGKTLAAEVVATELGLDLCRVDLAGVMSKYIGETEKNLQEVFDAAEESGWILFFDEADALFGRRTEVKDSHDRYANIEINYLLQRMEQYRGLAVLATNRRSSLDRAFLRRLRFLVDFPLPDLDARRRIWAQSFPVRTPVGDLDFDVLAGLEMTGANISTVTTNAAFLAAAEHSPVRMHHVTAAVRREFAKLDQLLPSADMTGGVRR